MWGQTTILNSMAVEEITRKETFYQIALGDERVGHEALQRKIIVPGRENDNFILLRPLS